MDAEDFIKEYIATSKISNINHIIMNLPATSINYLELLSNSLNQSKSPQIHIYLFSLNEEDAKKLISNKLHNKSIQFVNIHEVRTVSPNLLKLLCANILLTN